MSYDVTFIARKPGQSWEEALDEHEKVVVAEPELRPLDAETRTRYERVADAIRAIEPAMERSDYEDFIQLSNEETGLQVSLYAIEVGISSPYWHEDESAEAVMSSMRAFARIIEEETGWQGYDPQQDAPFLDTAAPEGASAMSRITRLIHREGGLERGKRPWWRFW